jgi:predicted ATPase
MRINKFTITEFKNLQNFSIDFDENSFATVIVGQNGAGKSNLLEAFVIVFRDLDLGIKPSFKYQIDYKCRDHKVHVDADPERKKSYIDITVNGDKISYKRFSDLGREYYLPNYVFGYYSGPSNRMEKHFEKHQDLFYQDLIKIDSKNKPMRPLLYARHVHSQFALLSFFYEQDAKIKKFLRNYLKIEDFDSVLFILKEPPWKSKDGDSRFWYSRGVVQRFLSKLYELSLSPLRMDQDVTLEFRKRTKLEHLYLYLKDIDALRKLAGDFSSPQEFFKVLESTYISKLISEVRIRVKVRNASGSLSFVELSEGEQQLLMVLGLLRFTKEDESLFLLDEPDTHLNPAWSMKYIEFLENVVGGQDTSHIIMTTHDPLVISNLERSQVRILQFDEEKGLFFAAYPENDPVKMGYPEILTSDLFGLRSIINPKIQKLLDEKRELSIKEQLTEKELIRLSELNDTLDDFDFTREMNDPSYGLFVKEMTRLEREENLQKPILTKQELEKKQKIAAEVVKKLKSKRDEAICES